MHVHMWHVHLNIANILHAFCVRFECTSKCYHNERKYCSFYSATACCPWGHLDKVVQLDYKKITIHSEKFGVSHNNYKMKIKNKQHESQPTNYNLQT